MRFSTQDLRASVRALQGRSREPATIRGQIEGIGIFPRLTIKDAAGGLVAEQKWPQDGLDHRQATEAIFQRLNRTSGWNAGFSGGHRVVHGGTDFRHRRGSTKRSWRHLRALMPARALHQPHNLAPIDALTELAPHIPQVACFDTAFHRSQPQLAQLFAIPARSRSRRQALWVPRPFVRIYRAATGRDCAGSRERASAGCSSRQWRKPVCAPQRPQRRDDHGIHCGRGTHDGHSLRQHRSGGPALPDGREEWMRGRSRT